MLITAALAIFIALSVAWVCLDWLFVRHIERREIRNMIWAAENLLEGLETDADGVPVTNTLPPDWRFTRPQSGLYYELLTDKGSFRSPSLAGKSFGPMAAAPVTGWQHAETGGPYGERLLYVARRVPTLDSGRLVLVRVGKDDRDMRTAAAEFSWELALSLLVLGIVLSSAAYVQVQLGLRPLDVLRKRLEPLARSPSARLEGEFPREVQPLTEAINALADVREADLLRVRKRAADLAHSLKTPLAVLAAQSRRARTAGAVEAADGLDRAIAAVKTAIDAELPRSRAAALSTAPDESHALPVVEAVIGVIERTEQGESIVFEVRIEPDQVVPVAADGLAEMLGALIENATRHARRQVRVSGEVGGQIGLLFVEDDGPGMDDPSAKLALIRGQRLDEAGPGHGLGLSIVQDLVSATHGELKLGRSDLGGLSVELCWRHGS